jgi:hypothetical protein
MFPANGQSRERDSESCHRAGPVLILSFDMVTIGGFRHDLTPLRAVDDRARLTTGHLVVEQGVAPRTALLFSIAGFACHASASRSEEAGLTVKATGTFANGIGWNQ